MAAPSYTEDLTDLDTAEADTNWVELTGTVTLSGGSESFDGQGPTAGADPDYPFIQGSYSVTQDCTKDVTVGSLAVNNGTGTGGHGTDGAYLAWQNYMVASNIRSYANDGMMMCVGSSLTDFYVWVVGGVDKAPYPYGGWVNHAVNTSVTPDYTAGTPTATEQYIGVAVYVSTGSSKGEVHNADVIRYGRCTAIIEHGDLTNGYATIAGFAAQNDNSANRWGLIQETSGGYLWKGRMSLGTATNAVDFRDSGKTVFIQWTPKVTANFNLIEIINASSNIEMTSMKFVCLDTTTASRGRLLMTNQCDVDLTACSFDDMDTFIFDKGTGKTVVLTNTAFNRCNQVTGGGAIITGGTFLESTATVALLVDVVSDAALVTNTKFTSSGTGHGLQIGDGSTTLTTQSVTLTNLDFTGYDTADPGTAANKAIHVNSAAGGGTITLNISGGSGVTAATHVRATNCTVIVSADVTVTFAGMKDYSEVYVYKISDGSEVAHSEDHNDTGGGAQTGTTDNRSFAWSAAQGTVVGYRIHSVAPSGTKAYQIIDVGSFTVPASPVTININQILSRNVSEGP